MPQWRFGSFPNIASANGDDYFCPVWGGDADLSIEANTQLRVYTAYTLSDLRANITVLDLTGTVSVRIDGVTSTNVSVAVTVVGWVEDLTGSDALSVNSDIDILSANDGMHGDNMTTRDLMLTYESGTNQHVVGSGNNETVLSTSYLGFPNSDPIAAEDRMKVRIKRSQSASNLRVRLSNVSGDWTVAMRKNGITSTNLQISGITADGTFEDLTGSEAYVDGDDANFIMQEDVGGSIKPRVLQVDFNTAISFWGFRATNSFNPTSYMGFNFEPVDFAVDDNYFARIGAPTAQNLQAFVVSAESGNDVTLRINTTNSTNLTITIGTPGLLEDITGSEAIADGDSVVIKLGGVASADVGRTAFEMVPPPPPTPIEFAYAFWW